MARCIQCGNEFEPSRKINTLCSKKCLRARQSRQKNDGPRSVEKTCEQCGEKFFSGNSIKVTCSKKCSREKTLLRTQRWHKATAKRIEDEKIRRRCAEILEAVPPGTMTEDEAVEYAKDELKSNPRRMTRAERRRTKKTCLGCWNTFKTSNPLQVACSRKCNKDYTAARNKLLYDLHFNQKIDKTCVQCGKEFTTPVARQATCHKEYCKKMQDKRLHDAHHEKEMDRTCVRCGKEFRTSHPNKITCSKECGTARHNEQVKQRYDTRRKNKREKACAQCGKAFEMSSTRKVLCSKECAKIRQKEKAKRWRVMQSEKKR